MWASKVKLNPGKTFLGPFLEAHNLTVRLSSFSDQGCTPPRGASP